MAQSASVEGGVPVVRSSATEGFELLLRPDGASTLTVRFDPRDWLSSASFDSLVEDAACSVGAEVVCAGSVEQRCAADGGVAEMRDCADFDQACVRGVGCVDSVALDADGIARWPATPPEAEALRVSAPGYRAERRAVPAQRLCTVELSPTNELRIRARAVDGRASVGGLR